MNAQQRKKEKKRNKSFKDDADNSYIYSFFFSQLETFFFLMGSKQHLRFLDKSHAWPFYTTPCRVKVFFIF